MTRNERENLVPSARVGSHGRGVGVFLFVLSPRGAL